jgi:hypothetical protein
MECQHTTTQGREGVDRSSWCIACGERVLVVHDRPCRECAHYWPRAFCNPSRIGLCGHKEVGPMTVTADMHVTYYVKPGPHRHGLCFETKEA